MTTAGGGEKNASPYTAVNAIFVMVFDHDKLPPPTEVLAPDHYYKYIILSSMILIPGTAVSAPWFDEHLCETIVLWPRAYRAPCVLCRSLVTHGVTVANVNS